MRPSRLARFALVLAVLVPGACRSAARHPARDAVAPARIELGDGDVLYVIDGRPQPRDTTDGQVPPAVRALDPGEIVSVEVLKGPTALARYGHAGENGVVLISTKRKG